MPSVRVIDERNEAAGTRAMPCEQDDHRAVARHDGATAVEAAGQLPPDAVVVDAARADAPVCVVAESFNGDGRSCPGSWT